MLDAGIRPSTGSVGEAYDHAMAESFLSTLECELIARTSLTSKSHAWSEAFSSIEGWYKPRPRHSALGYESPNQFAEAALATAAFPGP